MGAVLAVVPDSFEELKFIPAMVHENISLELCVLVGVHNETPRLRQAIDRTWVNVKRAAFLHLAEADCARGLVRIAIEKDLIDAMVGRVELSQCGDQAI